MCVCVCVCVLCQYQGMHISYYIKKNLNILHTHTHTHTHIYIHQVQKTFIHSGWVGIHQIQIKLSSLLLIPNSKIFFVQERFHYYTISINNNLYLELR